MRNNSLNTGSVRFETGKGVPRLFAGLVVSVALTIPAFALETFSEEARRNSTVPRILLFGSIYRR